MSDTDQASYLKERFRFRLRTKSGMGIAQLKAVKGKAGLISTSDEMGDSEHVLMIPVGPSLTEDFRRMQLFATVGKAYPKMGLYEMAWDKLVSPTGLIPLLEFLRSVLGLRYALHQVPDVDVYGKDPVSFVFDREELAFPTLGLHAAMRTPGSPGPSTEDVDQARAAEVAPVQDSVGRAEIGVKEPGGRRNVAGISMKEELWEQLGNLDFKATTFEQMGQDSKGVLFRRAQRILQEGSHLEFDEELTASRKARGFLSRTLRRLADKLGSEDESGAGD